MNRHQECITDGVKKLHDLALDYSGEKGMRIKRMHIGLHIYNVLAWTKQFDQAVSEAPLNSDIKGVTYKSVPVVVDHENHNRMPDFTFK